MIAAAPARGGGTQATATAFAALFSVVGLSLYGLPLYYDFMVRELGWSRTMVTSGNAISKLVVGPLFGFAAGWIGLWIVFGHANLLAITAVAAVALGVHLFVILYEEPTLEIWG